VLAVEARPVVLFFGDVPLYRTLSDGATGPDVLLLEQNLAALGYGGFTVDSTFTSGTAAAVKRWQKALDLPETGVVDAGAAVVAPAAVRIESVTPVIGEVLSPGTVVATATGTGHGVRVELERRYRALAVVGGPVRVSLFGGTAVDGQVAAIGTTATAASDTGQQQPTAIQQQTIGVDITVTSPESALGGVFEGPVTVEFPGETRQDVLHVPIEALTLNADGGYAVVVVLGGRRRTVSVTTGLITSNQVEVTGVAEGMRVEVPDL
jgi:peptidoglycan hydrolase-like protein with peptidoglycan-binding domain